MKEYVERIVAAVETAAYAYAYTSGYIQWATENLQTPSEDPADYAPTVTDEEGTFSVKVGQRKELDKITELVLEIMPEKVRPTYMAFLSELEEAQKNEVL